MSITFIPTQPVDLVTSFRPASKNGPPSSSDYNDTQRTILMDLHSIEHVLNQIVLPVLTSLPAQAADGLRGDSLLASSDNESALFFDRDTDRPLTVAEVLQVINGAVNRLQQKIRDIESKLVSLNSKLATTNQTDIVHSVQSFLDQMRTVSSQVAQIADTSASNTNAVNKFRTYNQTFLLDDQGSLSEDIVWLTPMSSPAYTVLVSTEADEPAQVQWKKFYGDPEAGIAIHITGAPNAEVVFHAIAKED